LFETFSMVACEAMLHKLPIVATKRGSLPELVVDGVTGILMEPTNSKSITAAVLHLLKNPNEARDMGQKGYTRVQRLYSLEAFLQNLAEVVKSAQLPIIKDVERGK
jgi:glycosyltransferase involved in cell wall biosynthesis